MTDTPSWITRVIDILLPWILKVAELAMLMAVCFLLGYFYHAHVVQTEAQVVINAPNATILPQEFTTNKPPIIVHESGVYMPGENP